MRLHRVGGALGFVLVLGACEVHVGDVPPAGAPPPPPPPQQVAANHAPAPPPPPPAAPAPPPAQHPAASPAPAPAAPAGPQSVQMAPHPASIHFPLRIVHPVPVQNAVSGTLDVQALKVKLRMGMKCGPRESTPGHWIHVDCNKYTHIGVAKKVSGRKLRLMLSGKGKLDNPIGAPNPTANPAANLPDAVDHRKDGLEGPVKDQGQVGSCTSFSLSSAMDNGIIRLGGKQTDATSSLHIWSHYGYPNMEDAGNGNLNKPIAPWTAWPYDERIACEIDKTGDCGPYSPPPPSFNSDSQLHDKIKAEDGNGVFQITEYDDIGSDPDTIAGLLATGADVWFAMQIGEPFMTLKGDTIGNWTPAQIEGGHAILFTGYRHVNGKRQFLIHNSWGKDWGDGGYAYVNEEMLKQFLDSAYKVVVSNNSTPPPPPNPNPNPQPNPNELTDDDCGEDELVDSVTGQCATICADDSRPANGQCVGAASHKGGQPPPPPPAPPHPGHFGIKH